MGAKYRGICIIFMSVIIFSSFTLANPNEGIKTNFYANGNLIASVKDKISGDGNVTFYNQDRLGSNRITTDKDGNILGQFKSYPYGQPFIKDNVDYPFTGKEQDDESEFYYFGARHYDSDTGRFIQVDPMSYSGGNLPYSYVGNNPIGFVDPSGMQMYGADVLEINFETGASKYSDKPSFVYLWDTLVSSKTVYEWIYNYPTYHFTEGQKFSISMGELVPSEGLIMKVMVGFPRHVEKAMQSAVENDQILNEWVATRGTINVNMVDSDYDKKEQDEVEFDSKTPYLPAFTIREKIRLPSGQEVLTESLAIYIDFERDSALKSHSGLELTKEQEDIILGLHELGHAKHIAQGLTSSLGSKTAIQLYADSFAYHTARDMYGENSVITRESRARYNRWLDNLATEFMPSHMFPP